MQELTREQEAKIASLAIDHGSVRVTPRDDGTVRIDTDDGAFMLDADGNDTGEEFAPAEVSLMVPVDVIKEMIGVEIVNKAIASAEKRHGRGSAWVAFTAGTEMEHEFVRVLRSMVLA